MMKIERMVMVVKTAVYDDIKAKNRPSLYATPLAWATADFTQSLIDADGGVVLPYQTGMIVVSDECSLSTIRELSRTAAQGTISPLRFAGASPSVVAGLPALQQGLRGPTLSLTMPPQHAPSAIVATIDYWMRYSNVLAVLAIAHHREGERRHLLKGLVVRSVDETLRRQVLQLCGAE